MSLIPMLEHYAREFESGGSDTPAGRKGRVFARLCQSQNPTRKKLAEEMRIRPATVSAIMLDMINDGLVLEARPEKIHQKGRPEIILSPNPNALAAVVCSMVSQTINCTLINLAGETLYKGQVEAQADQIDNDTFLDIVASLYSDCLEHLPKGTKLAGVAMSIPGIVDKHRQIWRHSSHWPRLRNVDLSKLACLHSGRIMVSKSLDCELRARLSRMGCPADEGVLLLHWGFGIGAAFQPALDTPFSRARGFGEVGHSCADLASKAMCKCGMTGCVEAEAGLWALAPKLSTTDAPIDEWQFEQYLRENPTLDIGDRPIDLVAMTLRNLFVTLLPDQCVITGPFSQNEAIFSRLLSRFDAFLPESSLVVGEARTKIRPGRAGTKDEIIGAATTVFRPALKELCGV